PSFCSTRSITPTASSPRSGRYRRPLWRLAHTLRRSRHLTARSNTPTLLRVSPLSAATPRSPMGLPSASSCPILLEPVSQPDYVAPQIRRRAAHVDLETARAFALSLSGRVRFGSAGSDGQRRCRWQRWLGR